MRRQAQEGPGLPVRGSIGFATCRALLVFLACAVVLSHLPPAQAREPAWNYSQPGVEIGGVAVSPKGDLIAAGAGKVLFFSRDGVLIDQEPFGSDVRITADGKYTASAYSSTLYFFENPVPGGTADQQKARKVWDYELSEPVSSFEMKGDGSLIAGQTMGKGLFVFSPKTRVARGNNKETDSVIRISGGGIVGVSATKVHTYNTGANLTRTADLVANSAPQTLVLPSSGTAVFGDGQSLRSVNVYDGTLRWKRQVTGSITALAMTPGGSLFIAGTEAGTVNGIDAKGNISWSYAPGPENRQGRGITCIAVSDKGTVTAAGTADGKVLFLDVRGGLAGSWQGHEYIRHIAMSTDGSVVVAAADERLYAFTPGSPSSLPTPVPAPSRTGTAVTTGTAPSAARTAAQAPVSTPSRQATAPPAELPTTYSVIRTATQSPSAPVTLLVSLALAVAIAGRKR